MTKIDQNVAVQGKRTFLTVNCMNARLIEDVWPLCTRTGEKATFRKCRRCGQWVPYDSRFSALSLVTINVYGMTEKDRGDAENGTLEGGG